MLTVEKTHSRSFQNYIIFFLFLVAIWANVKSIFMNCDPDTEYAVAMSYRMLQGDKLFQQMWEPHQTSAFLCTLLMKPFVAITGGTTGIIIYLHTVGVLIHAAITGIFYSFMKKRTDIDTARLMSIFLLAVRPKDLVFPEFSNMQLWFSILLFLCLVYYLEHQDKKQWLLIASLCLCLEVISYPSCVIVWFPAVIVLWIYSSSRWKDILLFTGACMVQGCAYVGYFIVSCGDINTFWDTLLQIVTGDSSHQQSGKLGMGMFLEDFNVSLLLVAVCFLAAVLLNFLFARKKADQGVAIKKERFLILFGLLLFAVFLVECTILAERMGYAALFLLVILVALYLVKRCEVSERKIVVAGILLAAGSFTSTVLLTNLDLSCALMYLILGVAVSFIPLLRFLPRETDMHGKRVRCNLVLLFCVVVLFQRGTTVKSYAGYASPMKLGGIVRSGPAFGIVTDYLGAYVRNTSIAEWDHFVYSGDNVLIVEQDVVSALGYMYEDTTISAPSTICTPTFDEKLLEYWSKYPEKYPDVVAVQCWYGELKVDADSWIIQWLETECELVSVEEGTFWRYYRLKN